jgi:hypothetical protein
MKKMCKILSIGDIHGRSVWKDKLFGSYNAFEQWVHERSVGAGEVMADTYPINDYEKIIFVGDYVDSFTVGNAEMLKNLEDIIELKKAYPEKIVLLLGNHDVQYIQTDQWCSGFRPEMKHDFGKLFNDNIDLFQMAYYAELPVHEGRKNRKILWTHAGVTGGWLKQIEGVFRNEKHKKHVILREYYGARIDEMIQVAWELRLPSIFNVDGDSGGMCQWAGPIWVRPRMLQWEAIEGYDQIVGHTPKPRITKLWTLDETEESNPEARDLIVLIDCLEHGDGSFYEIEYEEQN